MARTIGSVDGQTRWEVLTMIVDFCETARGGPTLREVCEEVGVWERSTASYHIKNLIEEDLLYRIPGAKNRYIRPTEKGKRLVGLMREFEDETYSQRA